MSTIQVSVPDSVKAFLESQASARGYETTSAYVRKLILDAVQAEEKRRIDSLIEEGIQEIEHGDVSDMTAEDWRILREEYARKKGIVHATNTDTQPSKTRPC